MLVFFILMVSIAYSDDPWGKDAELTRLSSKKSPSTAISHCKTPILGKLAEACIRFHQTTITHADGPRSHFIPCSSQYALDAIRKYGFFKGFAMGCDRLMRENDDPWIYRTTVDGAGNRIKWDPVP